MVILLPLLQRGYTPTTGLRRATDRASGTGPRGSQQNTKNRLKT